MRQRVAIVFRQIHAVPGSEVGGETIGMAYGQTTLWEEISHEQ